MLCALLANMGILENTLLLNLGCRELFYGHMALISLIQFDLIAWV